MEPKDCPNAVDLEKFVQCSVSEPESASISSHLDACPKCEETVMQIERDHDTVAEHIRKAVAVPTFANEPECQQLIASLIEQSPGQQPAPNHHAPATAIAIRSLQNLRDYQIIAKLGEGGMGAVYKAVHQKLKRIVALKVLPSGRLVDKQTVERFEREMSVLGQLNHPNIVQALDAGEHDGQHYLVMEYVEGSELSEIIQRCPPLSIADACSLISQAATGLQYAHEHGFVHRDIKPSNLMLTTQGVRAGEPTATVKILDLGLARALEQPNTPAAATPELTIAGQVMGTIDYMAPEQGNDSHDVDIRADIYSLGATLYKLLTGDSPFVEYSQRPTLQRLMAIAQNDPPSIRSKRPDVPEKLARVIHRMLAKKPENRFATPQEVVQALEPFCAGADLAALLPGGVSRGNATTVTYQGNRVAPQESEKKPRNRLVAVASSSACVVMLAAVLLMTTRKGTVEVTSPDGKLPDDVKIVVTKGGEEIELLQADNKWTASIVNGEYQAQLRSGSDTFEIKNSKLIVNRMGKAVITVEIRKPNDSVSATTTAVASTAKPKLEPSVVKPQATPTTTTNADSSKPEKTLTATESTNPYVVLCDGQERRSFKTLAGAIGDLQAGEIIEVRSNSMLRIQLSGRISKPLTIRAAAGFRPLLSFVRLDGQSTFIDTDVNLTNCDLDFRQAFMVGNGKMSWTMQGCRVWGHLPRDFVAWRVKDCVLLAGPDYHAEFTVVGDHPSECILENCVIHSGPILFQAEHSSHKLRLSHCTYISENPYLFQIGEHAKLDVEANDNLFICRSAGLIALVPTSPHQSWMTKTLDNVNWQGRHNCYAGEQFGVWRRNADQHWVPVAQGLDAWNRLWKNPEQDSIEIADIRLEYERIQQMNSPDRLRDLATAMTDYVADHQLKDAGPQWELVGPGDAYVRALAASGRNIPEADLRPEQHEAGPFDLHRNNELVRSYPTLQEAVDAALDKDEIEIRMDGPCAGVYSQKGSRLLTIRSAPGYRPEIGHLVFEGTDELILEGLAIKGNLGVGDTHRFYNTVASKIRLDNRPCIRRMANCSVLSAIHVLADLCLATRDTTITPEIVNCDLTLMQLTLRAGGNAKFTNSVFRTIYVGTEDNGTTPGTLEVDHCLAFAPSLTNAGHMNLAIQTPTRLTSSNTIFVSPLDLVALGSTPNPLALWTGTKNVYLKNSGFLGGGAPPLLEQHQAQLKTDLDSIELPPWEFDPSQWRVCSDSPTGKLPPAENAVFGANIEELTNVIRKKLHPATPPGNQ